MRNNRFGEAFMIRAMSLQTFLLLLGLFASSAPARGEVRPHGLISEGMVLQRERDARVWGTAAPGERIVVRFRDREATTVAEKGRWSIRIPSGQAGGPFPLSIAGDNSVVVQNVYVGEVWICSGQSNMGWPVGPRPGDPARRGTENPEIRLLTVPSRLREQAELELPGARWEECGPETVGGFSAVAYSFGRDLHEALKVPIGLIHASYGGSPIEQWIDSNSAADPGEGKRGRTKVARPALYNGMIAPLVPYTIRGVIWYQGEANANAPGGYERLFESLIAGWRKDWGQGDFPFLFVQVAPYGPLVREPQESLWAELREAQRLVSRKVEGTGMVVITDYGHETDIHPKPKEPVGQRLARLAHRLVYQHDVVASGPSFESMQVDANEVILKFRDLGGGLVARPMELQGVAKDPRTGKTGGSLRVVESNEQPVPLQGFTVAGADGRFQTASAEIRGDTVVLWNRNITDPVAVRFGWADYPSGNLFNKAGLPASPFQARRLGDDRR